MRISLTPVGLYANRAEPLLPRTIAQRGRHDVAAGHVLGCKYRRTCGRTAAPPQKKRAPRGARFRL